MSHYPLWRRDENGSEFLVAAWSTREEAERQQREFERRGHKQSYFVIEVTPEVIEPEEAVDLERRS
jgi:hypothetical protein